MSKLLISFVLLSIIIFISSCASSSKEAKKGELLYQIGTKHLINKEYTLALISLKKALKKMPDDSRIHNNLAMAYYFKKDIGTAKKLLHKSIKLDTNNSDARNNLASIYLQEGKLSEARTQYTHILKDLTYSNQFRTHFNLSVLAQKENKIDQALKHLDLSIQENVNYCPAHFEMANIYSKKKEYDKAYKSYRSASMGSCYDNPAPHYYQAVTLLKQEKHDLALTKFEEITSRFTNSKFSSMSLANINEIKSTHNKSEFETSSLSPFQLKQRLERNISSPNF